MGIPIGAVGLDGHGSLRKLGALDLLPEANRARGGRSRASGRRRRTAAALATFLALGCAGRLPYPGDRSDTAEVVVDNRSSTVSIATLYLVPDRGARRRLGNLNLGERKRFTVDITEATRYHLLADAGVHDLVSREFTLTGGDVVEWDMHLNRVILREAGRVLR